MYDANTIRKQLEELWASFIVEQTGSRRERATKYKTKKIIMQAHGVRAYYQIDYPLAFLALSHDATDLKDLAPFALIMQAPTLIGSLGAAAEVLGLIEASQAAPVIEEEIMDEEMFFAQHFGSSMSDTLSGIRKNNF